MFFCPIEVKVYAKSKIVHLNKEEKKLRERKGIFYKKDVTLCCTIFIAAFLCLESGQMGN